MSHAAIRSARTVLQPLWGPAVTAIGVVAVGISWQPLPPALLRSIQWIAPFALPMMIISLVIQSLIWTTTADSVRAQDAANPGTGWSLPRRSRFSARSWGAVTRGERGTRIAYLIPADAIVEERAEHGRFLMWHKGPPRRLLHLASSAAFIAGVALVSHAFISGRDALGLQLTGLGAVGLAAVVLADALLRPRGDARTIMVNIPGPDWPEAAWTGVWGLIDAYDHAGQLARQGSYPLSDWRALQASVWELAGQKHPDPLEMDALTVRIRISTAAPV